MMRTTLFSASVTVLLGVLIYVAMRSYLRAQSRAATTLQELTGKLRRLDR